MRYAITDDLWAAFGTLVDRAKRNRQGQKPGLPDRPFFEALLYLARTGVPWRDLPGEFGAWDAVYNRFRRWVASGSLAALFRATIRRPPVRRRPAGVDRLDHRPGAPARGRRPVEKKRIGAGRSAAAQGPAAAAAG